MAYPIVVVKQHGRKPIYLSLRERIELGRDCDGMLLADPQVSRRHASLSPSGDRVIVEDLGSTNGTFLDGERMTAPIALEPGSHVRLGGTTLELLVGIAPAGAPITADPPSDVPGGIGTKVGMPAPTPPTPWGPSGIRETSIDLVAQAVRVDQPGWTSIEQDQGTVTIVFSDIESSTERATAMGDDAWMKVLGAHNEIIRRNLPLFGGTEVKNQGDGFMLTFPGARRALRCMIAVQQELTAYGERHPDQGVRIRVGVHTGEVVEKEGDIFGKHVMMAARVANLARGGEILVSALVRELASARGDLAFGEARTTTLKGIEGEHTVYPLRWEKVPESG